MFITLHHEKPANQFAKQKMKMWALCRAIAFLSVLRALAATSLRQPLSLTMSLGFGNVEPLLKPLLPFFQHLPQSFPLVRRQNRIHSILRTIENSFYLTQIQRAQVA